METFLINEHGDRTNISITDGSGVSFWILMPNKQYDCTYLSGRHSSNTMKFIENSERFATGTFLSIIESDFNSIVLEKKTNHHFLLETDKIIISIKSDEDTTITFPVDSDANSVKRIGSVVSRKLTEAIKSLNISERSMINEPNLLASIVNTVNSRIRIINTIKSIMWVTNYNGHLIMDDDTLKGIHDYE